MKQFFKKLSLAFVWVASFGAFAGESARVIEFHTEKVGDAMHWMPEKVNVSPGEKVKFVLKHGLSGGLEFHGFTIRELDIVKQVDRNKVVEVERVIPKDLKAGEYKVTCQFHPKHMAASFIVVGEAAAAATPAAPPAAPVKK